LRVLLLSARNLRRELIKERRRLDYYSVEADVLAVAAAGGRAGIGLRDRGRRNGLTLVHYHKGATYGGATKCPLWKKAVIPRTSKIGGS
jgi:hypothetical protein